MKVLPSSLKKILVIKNNFIGDTVLTVPFLRNLREKYPESIINILTDNTTEDLLIHCPYVSNLISYCNNEKTFANYLNHYKLIKKDHYDCAFILKRSFSAALITFMAGIPYRVGFNTDNRGLLLTHKVNYDLLKHEVDSYLDLLKSVNVPVNSSSLEAWTSEENVKHTDKLLTDFNTKAVNKVIVSMSTTNPNKMWPISSFEKLILELVNKYDTQVFFIGLIQDLDLYEKVINKIRHKLKYPIVNLIGKTSLLESLELLNKCVIIFREKCIDGITVNEKKCKDNLEKSTALVTALVHHIGYDKASSIAKKALKEDKTIRDILLTDEILSTKKIEKILNPYELTKPGIPGLK